MLIGQMPCDRLINDDWSVSLSVDIVSSPRVRHTLRVGRSPSVTPTIAIGVLDSTTKCYFDRDTSKIVRPSVRPSVTRCDCPSVELQLNQ